MNRYDLHTHSTASDGTFSPSALVRRARERGVEVMGLTDHDCTDGIAEAETESAKIGLTLIPGVEISATWEQGQLIHIVGLRIDRTDPVLQAGLLRLYELRNWRAEEMGQRFANHGILGTLEGARALAKGAIVSRVHFARFLVANGHSRDINDAFDRFLVKGKPGFVDEEWATLRECIDWIHSAGGQAVLAHPLRYSLPPDRLRRLVEHFRDAGGEGIEVTPGSSAEGQTSAHYACEFNLVASIGSDFHGHASSNLNVGLHGELPKTVRPIWETW